MSEDALAMEGTSASCPRCGYDQRGVMSQWSESCPLNGTCAECGLEFFWAEVIQPEKYEPQWCIEFAPRGFRNVLASCAKTTARTLWPWSFWKRQNMAFEVRWRRLAIFLFLICLLPLFMYVVEQTFVAVKVRMLVEENVRRDHALTVQSIPSMKTELTTLESAKLSELPIELSWIDTDEELQARVQGLKQWLQVAQATATQPPIVYQPLWRAVYEAVFTPRSYSTNGTVTGSWGGIAGFYPRPVELHDVLLTQFATRASFDDLVIICFTIAVATIAVVILMPIEFALLPFSRRKAKVRWRHVWRVAAYSMTPLIVVSTLVAAIMCIGLVIPTMFWQLAGVMRPVPLVFPIIVVVWWAVAIKRYLRMPHGWLIAPLFFVLAILLGSFLVGVVGSVLFA